MALPSLYEQDVSSFSSGTGRGGSHFIARCYKDGCRVATFENASHDYFGVVNSARMGEKYGPLFVCLSVCPLVCYVTML